MAGATSTITIETEIYEQMALAAGEQETSVEALFAEAARRYVWDLNRRKISAESQVYRQHHAELRGEFLGQYVAMRDGQVVDHDADLHTLRRRVRERFGRAPMMITQVTDEAIPTLTRLGFRQRPPAP